MDTAPTLSESDARLLARHICRTPPRPGRARHGNFGLSLKQRGVHRSARSSTAATCGCGPDRAISGTTTVAAELLNEALHHAARVQHPGTDHRGALKDRHGERTPDIEARFAELSENNRALAKSRTRKLMAALEAQMSAAPGKCGIGADQLETILTKVTAAASKTSELIASKHKPENVDHLHRGPFEHPDGGWTGPSRNSGARPTPSARGCAWMN
jgi:hypothetical protein